MTVAITQTADPAGVNTASSVVTYSTVSIGTASSDRIIAVCSGNEENTGASPVSATIDYGSGDVAMLTTALAIFTNVSARIFYLHVPTGTTATIKVTWTADATSIENHIAVYSVTGGEVLSSGTSTSTDMDATAPLTTGSITIPTGGGFLAVAAGGSDAVGKTWANATEDLDEDAGGYQFTTATRVTAGTVTVTCTGGTNNEDGALAYMIFYIPDAPPIWGPSDTRNFQPMVAQ